MDTELRSRIENTEVRSPVELTDEAAMLVETVRAAMGDPSEPSLRSGFERVQVRSAHHLAMAGRRRAARIGASALALVLVVGAGLLVRTRTGSEALSYRVEGVPLIDDGYVRTPAGERAWVRFSDGSNVELSAGTQARIRSLDAHGAQVALEDGELFVAVVHRPAASWLVEAGPFRIHVRGTRFGVAWSGSEGKLEVRLLSGALSVGGPLSEEPIALRGGQRLTVVLGAKQVILDEIGSEPLGRTPSRGEQAGESLNGGERPADREPAGEMPRDRDTRPTSPADGNEKVANPGGGGEKVANSADGNDQVSSFRSAEATPSATIGGSLGEKATSRRDSSGRDSAGREPAPKEVPAARSWAGYLAEGNLQAILDEAQRRGLESTIDQCTSGDLSILADAARYKGHIDIAERALIKQRDRFAGSVRAHDAAFLLGRLQETRGTAGLANAINWYDRYLSEVPGGTYASESLGRKMTATERLYGPKRARPIASIYLRQYPNGAYAAAARALVQTQ